MFETFFYFCSKFYHLLYALDLVDQRAAKQLTACERDQYCYEKRCNNFYRSFF